MSALVAPDARNVVERPARAAPGTEDRPPYTSRVLHYWYSLKGEGFDAEQARYPDGSLLPWSAVFVSYLMKAAGVGSQQFPASQIHGDYFRAVLDRPGAYAFAALDAAEHVPAAGDLLCAPRGEGNPRPASLAQRAGLTRQERNRPLPLHCDLVVEATPEGVGAIGGNVNESLVWTQVPVDGQGRVVGLVERPWLVLLRNQLS